MSATLYVGHVAYETTEVSLQTVFERAGTVISCDLVRDNFSGRPMGFAYVEMSSESEAIKAVEQLNGEELNGRQLHVGRAIDFPTYRPASRSVLPVTARESLAANRAEMHLP